MVSAMGNIQTVEFRSSRAGLGAASCPDAGLRFVRSCTGNKTVMLGQLITLPLRISIAATRLVLEVAGGAAEGAVRTAHQLTGSGDTQRAEAKPRQPDAGAKPRQPDEEPLVRPELAVPDAGVRAEAPPRPRRASQAPREPRHVSEEPELVEEVAEPGAQDGAGAEVRVEEPWEGYRRMSAKEVIARLGNASTAELTAVGLYENGNQGRQTVLSAVERGLRTANRSS